MADIARSVEPAPDQRVDPLLYRIIVVLVGAVAVIAVLGSIALSWYGHPVPDLLPAMGGAAMTGLTSMLVISNQQRKPAA